MTKDRLDYVCDRCGTDWEGAPGHPNSYCDSIVLEEVAKAGLAFLESKRSDTGAPFMRFKQALEKYFRKAIS